MPFYFGSDWIRSVQNGSNLIKLAQIGFLNNQKMFLYKVVTFTNWTKMAILFWLRLDQICPKWIKLDQIGSNWIKKDQDGLGWLFGSNQMKLVQIGSNQFKLDQVGWKWFKKKLYQIIINWSAKIWGRGLALACNVWKSSSLFLKSYSYNVVSEHWDRCRHQSRGCGSTRGCLKKK